MVGAGGCRSPFCKFFLSRGPFLGHWEMGVFGPRNPLSPILAILTLVGGGRVRNTIGQMRGFEEGGGFAIVG